MTRLDTLGAFTQERGGSHSLRSRIASAWSGTAGDLYLELDLAGAFMGQKFGFLLYSSCPQNSLNHSASWHGQLLTLSAGKEVHRLALLYFLGAEECLVLLET